MADLKKRITSLTEKTALTSGDFAAVDNTSGGTKKFNLYQLTQDVADNVASIDSLDTAVDGLTSDMAGKADADGSYEGMTVGNAKQLLSDVYTEDSEPYKYRASFSGDREFDEIVGGTVAWNQLRNESYTSRTADGITTSYSNGLFSIKNNSRTANYSAGSTQNGVGNDALVVNHVYALIADSSKSIDGVGIIYSSEIRFFPVNSLLKIPTDYTFPLSLPTLRVTSSYDFVTTHPVGDVTTFTMNLFDLTQMFGSTIADYIYAQEQATAGAGVAIFRKLFPASYYAYNAGELISVSGLSAHVMRDANNNIIGNYPLDSSLTLRGVPKLADGKMYFDGDTYASDGTVTRKYGIVDLGTLTWTYQSGSNPYFQANFAEVAPSGQGLKGDLIASKFYAVAVSGSSADKIVAVSTAYSILYIRDLAYTNVATFKQMLTDQDVKLVYKLTTATTETAEPFMNPQIVSEYGTEEYVSTTICPVGHNTKYPENLRKKIEGLPWDLSMIAPIENGTTASKAYSVGQYFLHNDVFCKAKTSIASGATFTLNTNYTETTVAAELYSALH